MNLATVSGVSGEEAVVVGEQGVVRVADVVADAPTTVLALLESGRADEVLAAAESTPVDSYAPLDSVRFTAPYRRPHKIWGIGLNYVDHAGDLSESVPEEPASFIKADHTVIGDGDPITIPRQSERTTAEAELGLVIGRECRDVAEADALSYVFGVCTILDQTAEDILQRNPRFLTRSKNFPGFFSFGPQLVPMSSLGDFADDLGDVEVATIHNGRVHRRNTVAHMRYSPAHLVAFHSQVMPLYPGDIISTGTPGAVVIESDDVVECDIPGIGRLRNPVA
ncbi:fumarylacetoacetate hydrolase family protein [Solicola gregarius]|uniref:Fumarylacetoacetate hydrolase family protein n=1 Tax=Solicola gregarius TaxID=2908642 RepID=A0AA46TFZ0_9ACTN|nr:fumarylacetoacetate hydrolase family protein [Solicola gregarius]UYM04644.1 fumarylacetoacetate hydrolase family protein [Solicola gregarius]